MASTITAQNFNLEISESCDLNMQPHTASYIQTFASVSTLVTNTIQCQSGTTTSLLKLDTTSGPFLTSSMRYFSVCNRDNGAGDTPPHLRISLSGSDLGYVNYKLEAGQKLIFYNNQIANGMSGSSADPVTGDLPFIYKQWTSCTAVASGSSIMCQTVYGAIVAG